MKKIIGIVIASLVFCNVGHGEIKMIESETIGASHSQRYLVSTVCVDGYKFVIAKAGKVHSMSMVQFYTDQSFHEGRDLPAKC